MAKYAHRLNDGTPVRRVQVEYWINEKDDERFSRWARRRGQSLRQWLEAALREGVDERLAWELDEDSREGVAEG